jgi:hypothetical protein
MSSPRYQHDCTNCRFLGTVATYDLYVCEHIGGDSPSLIARYGAEGSQYASRGFMTPIINEITQETGGLDRDQALVLALFRGLPSLILNIWSRS